MKRNRKIIRYSARYSRKARTKRFILKLLLILVIAAAVGSLGLIITGYIVGGEDSSSAVTSASDISSSDISQNGINDTSEVLSSDSDTVSGTTQSDVTVPETDMLSGAVTMPLETILSDSARVEFIETAVSNGYSSVIFEAKNTNGNVLYNTEVELAAKCGAVSTDAFDLKELVSEIHAGGLKAIALMNALQDPLAAHTDYGTSYKYGDTDITWLDNSVDRGGKPWMNPYLEKSQQYLTDITSELAGAGCDIIAVDKLVFPTAYTSKLNQGSSTVSRQEMLSQLCQMITNAAGESEVVYCFDAESYFGKNTAQYNGTPGGIDGLDSIAPRIDLSKFSGIDALKDMDTSKLTVENLKIILDEIRNQCPDAQITPIFSKSEISEEVIALLEEYEISTYFLP